MNAKAWLDLLQISSLLAAGTMMISAVFFAATGQWLDVFYPFTLLGCLLALHRLNNHRRRIKRAGSEH